MLFSIQVPKASQKPPFSSEARSTFRSYFPMKRASFFTGSFDTPSTETPSFRYAKHGNAQLVEFVLQRGKILRLIGARSEEHTSELQSLMRSSYAVFCLKKKKSVLKT